MEVILVDWPVSMIRRLFGVLTHRAPEVRHHAVRVINCLNTWFMGPPEQHGTRAEKGLNVVRYIP